MFLSRDQLKELTDLTQPGAQIRWLTNKGFKFELGASGRPKVLIAEVEKHMLTGARRVKELNLDGLS